MSSLPSIAPPSRRRTPLPTAISVPTSGYSVYPPRLPSAPEIPSRLNPLRPPPPQRRTVSWETVDAHHQNARRSLWMKQREHFRYHNAWSKYYYGSSAEKEQYGAQTRSVLKQQMADNYMATRQSRVTRNLESVVALERDRRDRDEDARNFRNKYNYLKTFRDENKKMMESSWHNRSMSKRHTDLYDSEALRYNPINWSCTLK
ncbi:hypothetical protein NP493_1799g00012 [Ridgeia piscesae]|uniref:Uncharacterized protein n=1 Tax=Ridgeia piscesae TaxID=27915 RepID=A0AAD9JT16_RIDPI|nr:hypothetical protein NP493_1799g00012 [Ridgeia piscesae]